jgi:glycine/D-amino acid oxidase-like deaminating enzyme
VKVIVVGAGVVGLSTAWALARAGHEVMVFDQGPIPNGASASFDQHRLIRLPYGAEAGYCAMAKQALAAWNELWADIGATHMAPVGSLAVSTSPGDWTDVSARTMDSLGYAYRRLDAGELSEFAPYLKLPKDAWGLLSAEGGVLFAERIVTSLAELLRLEGVPLHPETRVAQVDPAFGSATLADGARLQSDAVVLATGAWTPKLRPHLAAQAVAHRQAVVYLEPPDRYREAWRSAPALVSLGAVLNVYAAPPADGTDLKFGTARHRRPGDPDAMEPLDRNEPAEIFAQVAPFLHEAQSYRVLGGRLCPYAVSPDERFVVERLGTGLAITGCTGHMFKFGPLLGREIARTVTGQRDFQDFARWIRGEQAA